LQRADPALRKKVIKARCRTDREFFAKFFFGPRLEYSFSDFHRTVLNVPKVAFKNRLPMTGWRRAIEVPRGNGKTTVAILIDVCHDIAYDLEQFIVIIAEGFSLSKSRLREVRYQIERNKLYREYFGDLEGEIWQAADIETANGIRIMAASMGGQTRGLLHPDTGARPTKVYLDDAEDSQDVLNPELRERDRRFFTQDIEGAATTDGRTNFQFSGTPLHREAMLPMLELNPGWAFVKFPAIRSWPKRMDLWERCREIWASAGYLETDDKGNPFDLEAGQDRVALAQRYYRANRKRMDEGADVLWPDGEPFFQLMVWRWTNGEAAFSKEKMLVPRDPGLATFEMETDDYPARGALRHRIKGHKLIVDTRSGGTREVFLEKLRFVSFHDPAKADPTARLTRQRKMLGDYAAIVTIGFEDVPGGGVIGHVVNAWVERQPPSVQVSAHFDLAQRWKTEICVLEVDTLALLKKTYQDEARDRKAEGRFCRIPLRSLERQTTNKLARVSSMEPAVVNAWLTFNVDLPPVYWNQMVDHPTADYDDGPDATEGAWRFGGRKRAGLRIVHLGV
jgi:hypothetical protein